MNRLTHILLILVLFLLTACGPEEEPSTGAAPEQAAETPTITVIPEEPAATTVAAPALTADNHPIELPTPDPAQVSGTIISEGGSLVTQITVAMARRFARAGYHANLKIEPTDVAVAFANFCKTDGIDIVNTARRINPQESEACQAAGREPLEFQIATGAVVIIVHPENRFLEEATLEQLARIFSNEATNWSDIDPSWPPEPIVRVSPVEGSPTFDYFINTVMNPVYSAEADQGKAALLAAANLQLIERDSQLIKTVSQTPNAIGYVGAISVADSVDRVHMLTLNGFPPSIEFYHEGQYPLTRPLFIYTDAKTLREKPQVAAFINYYLSEVNREIITVGLSPLAESVLNIGRQRWLDTIQQ